jgi:hypothetical protein
VRARGRAQGPSLTGNEGGCRCGQMACCRCEGLGDVDVERDRRVETETGAGGRCRWRQDSNGVAGRGRRARDGLTERTQRRDRTGRAWQRTGRRSRATGRDWCGSAGEEGAAAAWGQDGTDTQSRGDGEADRNGRGGADTDGERS